MNSPNLSLQKPLEEYIHFFERISSRSVRLLEKLAEPGMRFTNPFNDVQGVDAVERVLNKMFVQLGQPRIRVLDHAWGRDGHTVYLRWALSGIVKGRELRLGGVSEVTFTPVGKVIAHIDHWDSGGQILGTLPFIGGLWRRVRKKIGA